MSNGRFYQETFSQVHGSAEIRWEDYQAMRRGKSLKWAAALTAAVGLLAALSALAVAANFFGLRDILLPEQGRVQVSGEQGIAVPGEYAYKDFISLSGYNGTPESRALAEWRAFLERYDQDGAIISQVGNDPTGFEERYGQYLVYSQEMADTLEDIIARYGLKLHSRLEVVLPHAWPLAAGNFFRENVTPYTGYIYENGTFRLDGDAELGAGERLGYGTIEYQFSRSVKGTFDDVTLNIGELSDFEEWGFQAADGTAVTLGLGAHSRSLILADLGDSFVLVNVLAGREADDTFSSGAIGREELEELADSFVYSALKPVKTPDLDALREAGEQYMEEWNSQPADPAPEERPDPAGDALYQQTGISADVGQEFVQMLAERLEDGAREEIAELLVYPAQVTTERGTFLVGSPEEFLAYYDETVGQSALTLATDLGWEPQPFADGSGLAAAANGAVWFGLVEEGMIRIFTLQTDQWSVRAGD